MQIFGRVVQLLQLIKEDILNHTEKDHHLLRAMLYEVLMLLNRSFMTAAVDARPSKQMTVDRYVHSFVQMVNEGYTSQRNVREYADRLFITTNYLNKIVR